jgi:ATP-dependent DNA ligase
VYIGGSDELTEITRVSGMPDEQRLDIDEKKDLGRVVEVEYQDVGNGGRLIHPRFVRWRDDKPASQCRYDWEDL